MTPFDFFEAFDALPISDEPLSTEQLVDLERAEAARPAGKSHDQVVTSIDARRRAES